MSISSRKSPLFIVGASILWSFGGLCIKFIPWGAMSIIGIRAVFAATVFIVYRKSVRVEFTLGNISAALCLSATTILFVFANKLTTAAAAILLQFTAPSFIVLIELIFYGKKPRIGEVAAVTVTFMAMLLFFVGQLDDGDLLGNILAIGSGLTFAGVFVCNKRPDTRPEQSIFMAFALNAVIGLPFAFFQVTANPVAWAAVIFLGLVQVGIAYVLFSIGIKGTSALLACLISALEPVLNPVLVALAVGEVPGPFAAAGGSLIILTVIGYNVWAERQNASRMRQRE